MKKKLKYIFIILFTVSAFVYADSFYHEVEFYSAKIIKLERITETSEEKATDETVFTLEILSGDRKGQRKTVTYKGKEDVPGYVRYTEGSTIFIGLNKIHANKKTEEYVALHDIDNSKGLIILACIFMAALIAVGRLKGMISILGLLITVLLIFFVLIPLILKGFPVLPVAFIIALASIIFTIPTITGFTKKSVTAIIGAASGIAVSMIMSLIFGWLMHISGIVTDELLTIFYATNLNINLTDIALSGMILSALGAVIDISVSISSSINELFVVHPDVDFKTAFSSAMEVGRDNLGSMVNTLVMAYVGCSLSLILLIYLRFDSKMPISMIFSYNQVLIEILKSFAGCMGMIAAVPVTAIIGVKLNLKKIPINITAK